MPLLESLRVNVSMYSPYSYDAAVCELFYAAFKKADINPNKVPMGKTHFLDVIGLVVERVRQIPKQHLHLNWHHCLLHMFHYLTLRKI